MAADVDIHVEHDHTITKRVDPTVLVDGNRSNIVWLARFPDAARHERSFGSRKVINLPTRLPRIVVFPLQGKNYCNDYANRLHCSYCYCLRYGYEQAAVIAHYPCKHAKTSAMWCTTRLWYVDQRTINPLEHLVSFLGHSNGAAYILSKRVAQVIAQTQLVWCRAGSVASLAHRAVVTA